MPWARLIVVSFALESLLPGAVQQQPSLHER
jgi:hypothetical protein